ncbi:hypothetical protein Pcinc_006582 [Petrolisthes cinctipes]|uniref:Uncharacterized protein n=1 Tax=Petrolisthes cinctipes TaxID=88211 RepID=A0AAE1KZ18_PETCI|nr:hypothetical protein Pcinc_006582 [Petrolisthes cinctipes]
MTTGLDETGQYSDSELTKRWMEQLKDSWSERLLGVQICRFVSPKENRLQTGLEKSPGSSEQFNGVAEQERKLEL